MRTRALAVVVTDMFAVVALAVLDGVVLLLVGGLGRAGEDVVVVVDFGHLSEYEDDDGGAALGGSLLRPWLLDHRIALYRSQACDLPYFPCPALPCRETLARRRSGRPPDEQGCDFG